MVKRLQGREEGDAAGGAADPYRALATHSLDIIFFTSPGELRILEANRAAVEAYGYSREELLTLRAPDLRAPAERASIAGQLAAAEREGARFETVHLRRDGSTFPVEVSAWGVSVAGQRLVVSVVRDISARKAAEAALAHDRGRAAAAAVEAQAARAQLEAVFQSVSEGVAVFDARGRLVLANEAEARIGGYPSAAAMMRELDLGHFTRSYELRQLDGTPVPAEAWPVSRALKGEAFGELRLLGHRLDTGRQWVFEFSGAPVRGPDGEVTLAVVVTRDVTRRREMEEALRARELELEEAQRLVNMGSWYAPRGTETLHGSPQLKRLFGLDPAGPMPTFAEMKDRQYPAEAWARLVGAVRETLHTGQPCALEVPARRADGAALWVAARAEVVRDATGEVVGMRGTVQDLTDVHRAVLALAAERERLAVTLSSIGDAVVATDASARVTDFNPTAEALTGWSAAEATGRLLDEVFVIVDEDTGRPVESPVARVLREGVVVGLANHTALVARDGSRRPIADSGAPIRGPSGEVAGVVLVFRDQTEERRAERALTESEQRYSTLFALAPVALALSRRGSGTLAAVNDAFLSLFGVSREEALGRTTLELGLTEPASRDQVLGELERTGRVRELEVRRRNRRGEPLVLALSIDPLQLGGEPYLLTTLQDLTTRRRAEAALKEVEARAVQAQRLEGLGRLAGGVAHDFNNLLTVILSCAEELEDQLRQRLPPSGEPVEQIRLAGERARDLTRQLLAFARRQLVAPVELDLNALLAGSQRLLGRLLGEDVRLEVAPGPGLGLVRADPGQLEQVVLNLAVNARDAMPRGGTLALRTRNEARGAEAWVVLEVEDSGVGMPPEVQDHLFEPFFTTKEVGQGTGLGLATVYGIVSQAGGRVEVRSTPGQGTTFEVWLPRSQGPTPAPLPAIPSPAPRTQPIGGGTVLVVEDDALVRRAVLRALRGAGYRVLVAGLPREALELGEAELTAVDLLVTDVVMPDLDGRALAEQLRRRHPRLKVLYISGYTRDTVAGRGVLEPGVELLEKPFTGPVLLARVQSILERAGRRGG